MRLRNVIQITPVNHRNSKWNWECSNLEVLDDGTVWCAYSSEGLGLSFVRRIQPAGAPMLLPLAKQTLNYHTGVSIARDALNRLWFTQEVPGPNASGGGPWYCTYDPATNTMSTVKRLPSPWYAHQPYTYQDMSSWYDADEKVTWIVGEGTRVVTPYWSTRPTSGGLDRSCYRIDSQGNLERAFNIVEAKNRQPPWADLPGNQETKGDFYHGFIFWTERNSYRHQGPDWKARNVGLYGARILGRSRALPLLPGATKHQRLPIPSTDPEFLIWPGNVRQDAGRGFGVDADGDPWVVFSAERAPRTALAGASDQYAGVPPTGQWDMISGVYLPGIGWEFDIEEEHLSIAGGEVRSRYRAIDDPVSGDAWIIFMHGSALVAQQPDAPTSRIELVPPSIMGRPGLYRGRQGVNPWLAWLQHSNSGGQLMAGEVEW